MNGRIAHPCRALATISRRGLPRFSCRGLSRFSRSENGTVPFDELPTSPHHQCSTPYNVLRIVLGLLLLTAAALKGHQLATEPVVATGLLGSRWFLIGPRWILIGIVEFELFFGLWLLAGLFPRRTWQAALLCFGAFACVSLSKALTGETTCGCFGRVPVNPWYTLVLDMAAVTALLRFRPATNPARSPLPQAGEGPGVSAKPRRQFACVVGISLLLGIPAVIAMANYRPATLDASGDIFGDSEFVVLEPEEWVGKPFPLLKYIDIGDQLAEGEWIVVFYHHDCPTCQETLSDWERVSHNLAMQMGSFRFALAEMAPYAAHDTAADAGQSFWLKGRLSAEQEWFLVTPRVFLLDGGTVIGTGGVEMLRKMRRTVSLARSDPQH